MSKSQSKTSSISVVLRVKHLCVQGYWAEGGSWWPATLESILPDGDELELRVDPTPAYRDVTPLHTAIHHTNPCLHFLTLQAL